MSLSVGMDITITTEDLVLKSVKETDLPAYQELFSDPETMRMYQDNEARIHEKGVDAWKKEQMENIAKRVDTLVHRWKEGIPFSAFAIFRGKEFIGHVVAGFGDRPGESEIAYVIRAKDWNNGYGSQAVRAIMQTWLPYLRERGFQLDQVIVSVVVATVRLDNFASIRILEKNGFVKVDEKESYGYVRGVYQKMLA